MLKDKKIKIGDKDYIINGLDAITSISLLPVFQRVTNVFMGIAQGSPEKIKPSDLKNDLECLLIENNVLREIYEVSTNGNPLARNVTHHSQLPEEISEIGNLIQEIGIFIYGYVMPESDDKKK
jgi:hypothetical protein